MPRPVQHQRLGDNDAGAEHFVTQNQRTQGAIAAAGPPQYVLRDEQNFLHKNLSNLNLKHGTRDTHSPSSELFKSTYRAEMHNFKPGRALQRKTDNYARQMEVTGVLPKPKSRKDAQAETWRTTSQARDSLAAISPRSPQGRYAQGAGTRMHSTVMLGRNIPPEHAPLGPINSTAHASFVPADGPSTPFEKYLLPQKNTSTLLTTSLEHSPSPKDERRGFNTISNHHDQHAMNYKPSHGSAEHFTSASSKQFLNPHAELTVPGGMGAFDRTANSVGGIFDSGDKILWESISRSAFRGGSQQAKTRSCKREDNFGATFG